jgi:hypothetical protein
VKVVSPATTSRPTVVGWQSKAKSPRKRGQAALPKILMWGFIARIMQGLAKRLEQERPAESSHKQSISVRVLFKTCWRLSHSGLPT